jgi:hypothetical protein
MNDVSHKILHTVTIKSPSLIFKLKVTYVCLLNKT